MLLACYSCVVRAAQSAPPLYRWGVADEQLVTSHLRIEDGARDILRVYNLSVRLGMHWGDMGHLGNSTNRDGQAIRDCTHYCLDTSSVLREWAVLLLQRLGVCLV